MQLRRFMVLFMHGLVLASTIAFASQAHGQTARDIYVDQSGSNGNGSKALPYNNMDSAIADAEQWLPPLLGANQPRIHVAEGTYTVAVMEPGSSDARSKVFRVFPYLELYGGYPEGDFDSGRDPGLYPTILSGELGANDAYHVLHLWSTMQAQNLSGRESIIDGFTITGGNANGSGDNSIGGGALVYPHFSANPRPQFISCKFIANNASGAGGAVAKTSPTSGDNRDTLGIEFRNCQFIDNTTDGNGHGDHVGGGAISNVASDVALINCRFESNTSGSSGGAVSSTQIAAVNVEFLANTADEKGGAVFLGENEPESNLTNCLFAGNVADGTGNAGGAIYIDDGGSIKLCTIVHNEAPNGNVGGVVLNESDLDGLIDNSILWGNDDSGSDVEDAQVFVASSCAVLHSTVEGYSGACTGVTDDDPLFIDEDGADNTIGTVLDNNYRLQLQSPAVNTGSNALIPSDALDVNNGNESPAEELPWDLDANARVLAGHAGAFVDRGAYEAPCAYAGDCVNSDTFLPPPDGIVDGADLAILLGDWCETPNCCPDCCSDFVDDVTFQPPGDGMVRGSDLAYLLGQWGAGPVSCYETESESMMSGGNPFAETELGDMLEELIETEDEELAATIAALLYEMMGQ